ncbi:MAG TPA: putative 2OG-Fe(II) oxygenase [Pseudomonadales bacterium]
MEYAVRLHHAGRLDAAGALYREVLTREPGNLGALNGLGMIEFQRQRFDTAIALLERVVALGGEHAGFLMNLGTVLDRSGRKQQALGCYERAITAEPRYPDPYYNLGALHLARGDPGAAIEVFDRCIARIGREFHALAYKAHALLDAGRVDEARYLLDHDRFVRVFELAAPPGFADLDAFRTALAAHVRSHPSLRANVLSTVNGRHTGELLRDPAGPMAPLVARIDEAVRWYRQSLPADPEHPVVRWAPPRWKLTSWGVVMQDGGHERPHIHPNGWISGVLYLALPALIDDPDAAHQGWLRFGEPTAELPVKGPHEIRDYRPSYDRIILFPSYFYHGTVPFRSDEPRVCVSFDVEPLYD